MKNHLGIILLIAAVAAGIVFAPIIAPIYWDEIPQYVIGEYSFNQYMSLIDSFFGTSLADPAYSDFENFYDKDYGPVFEVLLIAMGKAAALLIPGFGWDDLIIMRHIAVYLYLGHAVCTQWQVDAFRAGLAVFLQRHCFSSPPEFSAMPFTTARILYFSRFSCSQSITFFSRLAH